MIVSLPTARRVTGKFGQRRFATVLAGLILAAILSANSSYGRATADGTDLLRTAIKLACRVETAHDAAALGAQLPGFRRLYRRPQSVSVIGWRARYIMLGGTLTIERLAPGGALRSLAVEYRSGAHERPRLVATANVDCTIRDARRLHYDEGGQPSWIEQLDAGLAPTGTAWPFNPPVPSERDPGGILVALVDTGVNYLLPELSKRLARDQRQGLLGYDYWDLDRRPFDADRIYVTGHSAGGHLAAMLLATDWPAFGDGLPPDLVKGACAISGLFELEPIYRSYLNDTLKLDADMAARNSPALQTYPRSAPLFVVLGEDESPEYHRQSEAMAAKWRALGYPCDTLVPKDLDHFAIVDCLIDPDADLVKAQLAAMKQAFGG